MWDQSHSLYGHVYYTHRKLIAMVLLVLTFWFVTKEWDCGSKQPKSLGAQNSTEKSHIIGGISSHRLQTVGALSAERWSISWGLDDPGGGSLSCSQQDNEGESAATWMVGWCYEMLPHKNSISIAGARHVHAKQLKPPMLKIDQKLICWTESVALLTNGVSVPTDHRWWKIAWYR